MTTEIGHSRWSSGQLNRGRRAAGIVFVLCVGLVAFLHREEDSVVFACFLAFVFVAVVLDSWLVFGTLAGIACGFVLQSPVHNGTLEALAWTTFKGYVAWTIIGFVMGLLIDANRTGPRSAIRNTAEERTGSQSAGKFDRV